MYPLLDSPARHRREPSTRQRVRGAVALLVLLAAVAGFGVFGGAALDGRAWLGGLPVDPRLLGWAVYAVPVAGLLLLIAPTRSRAVRGLALLLLAAGLVGAAATSRPRGMTTAEWESAMGEPAFVDALSATGWTLLAVAVVWAIVLVVMMATTARFDDLVARARRSSIWFGPLAVTASLAAAIAL